jgi:HAD superfamily hydrolase (TIGR01450 family)
LLLDAYGVLVDESGPLPGAPELIARLNAAGRAYFVLTNSASHLPEAFAGLLQARGVGVPPERVVSAGLLLQPYLRGRGLIGSRCLVLGTADAFRYVERAGGVPVAPHPAADAAVVVIADQAGFALPDALDLTLDLCIRRLDAGLGVELVLCNPDLIYPKAPGRFGITAGALAVVIEAVLADRYPSLRPRFDRLGKPHGPIFAEAARRAGLSGSPTRMVMIGDQIATDILGARRFGIDSALVTGGVSNPEFASPEQTPTWILAGLE